MNSWIQRTHGFKDRHSAAKMKDPCFSHLIDRREMVRLRSSGNGERKILVLAWSDGIHTGWTSHLSGPTFNNQSGFFVTGKETDLNCDPGCDLKLLEKVTSKAPPPTRRQRDEERVLTGCVYSFSF